MKHSESTELVTGEEVIKEKSTRLASLISTILMVSPPGVEVGAKRRRDRGGRREDSKPALVKRELEQLLDYKRRELRDLENGEGKAKSGQSLKSFQEEISVVKEQVDGLQEHLRKREGVLQGLKEQIEAEKASAR